MQLPIVRSLALVAIGNAALAGRNIKGFWPGDPMFEYTASLDFFTPRDDGSLTTAAQGPEMWFAKLGKRACRGLRLQTAMPKQDKKFERLEEHQQVGFLGGGPRLLIEAVYPDRSELWEGFDRVGAADPAQKKIWLTAYVLIEEEQTRQQPPINYAAAATDLRDALISIQDVARAIPGQPFLDRFAAALAALDGRKDPAPMPFMRYAQLSRQALRLINAAGLAWVFGTLGSWNDIAVSDALKPRYDSASNELFSAVRRAVLVSANSTYRQ